jgi:hypothetical protein
MERTPLAAQAMSDILSDQVAEMNEHAVTRFQKSLYTYKYMTYMICMHTHIYKLYMCIHYSHELPNPASVLFLSCEIVALP